LWENCGMAQIGQDITLAKKHLEAGALVAIPTETVYGLAANALDEKAVLDIFKVKNRPKFDPLIVHTHNLNEVNKYVSHIPDRAYKLAESFWPGPLTILLQKKSIIPDLITSGLPAVAIRIPRHELTLQLLKTLDFPLAAPSANPFGYVSPTTALHVEKQLGDSIPYILDGGSSNIGVESTIIGFDEYDFPTIYRLGGKKIEDIEALIGKVHIQLNKSSNPVAPGMLKSHYAPKKPLYVGDIIDLAKTYNNRKIGIISFDQDYTFLNPKKQIILSQNGSLDEAAKNIFAALREMDDPQIEIILTEKLPEEGLGRAVNDRVERASVR
jgi:L-threonylcarbamoyladenylate synthase